MIEKILNNTTRYGKIRASHEGSLHSSTLSDVEWKKNPRYIKTILLIKPYREHHKNRDCLKNTSVCLLFFFYLQNKNL